MITSFRSPASATTKRDETRSYARPAGPKTTPVARNASSMRRGPQPPGRQLPSPPARRTLLAPAPGPKPSVAKAWPARRSRERRFQLGPLTQLPHGSEIVIRCGITDEALLGEAAEHHKRVVGTSAEALRASEQVHQLGVPRWSGLHRAPREVVEDLVIGACVRLERQPLAFMPFVTGRRGNWSGLRRRQ